MRAVVAIVIAFGLTAADQISVTSNGITWTFAEARPCGTFCTGDPWVLAPVTIIAITTDLHAPGFTPGPGQDGSMLTPGGDSHQGYDDRLSSYRAERNAALSDGERISAAKPLVIAEPASLVSMVSWLYRSETDAEPGIPRFNGGTKAPRPVTRSGAILTILAAEPPADSFRPPYSGPRRAPTHRLSDLDLDRLPRLAAVGDRPDPARLAAQLRGPWIDHVWEYLGAMVHPSQNMPNYGRDMAKIILDATLLLLLDPEAIGGEDVRRNLAMPLVQFGIDCGGIADAGGGWQANGGHHTGRKLPILLAGFLLDDAHLLSVGDWDTAFHEDQQTFVVTAEDIARTHRADWKPDARAADKEPYTEADLGLADWGIRHAYSPKEDNRGWRTPYRDINGPLISGYALVAALCSLRETWKHEPLFAYGIRYQTMADRNPKPGSTNGNSLFLDAMWKAYASTAFPGPAP